MYQPDDHFGEFDNITDFQMVVDAFPLSSWNSPFVSEAAAAAAATITTTAPPPPFGNPEIIVPPLSDHNEEGEEDHAQPQPLPPLAIPFPQPAPPDQITIPPTQAATVAPVPVCDLLKQIKQSTEQSGLTLQGPSRHKRSTQLDEELAWSMPIPYKKRSADYRLNIVHTGVGDAMERIHAPKQIHKRMAKTNEVAGSSLLIYMYPFGGISTKAPMDNVCCMDLAWPDPANGYKVDDKLTLRLHKFHWDSDARAACVHTVIIPIPEHRELHEFRGLIDNFLLSIPARYLRAMTIYFEASRIRANPTMLWPPPSNIYLEQVVIRRIDEKYSDHEFGCVAHLFSLNRIHSLGLVGSIPGGSGTIGPDREYLASLCHHQMPELVQIRLGADVPPKPIANPVMPPPTRASKPKQLAKQRTLDPQSTTVSAWATMLMMTASPVPGQPKFPRAITVQLPNTVNKEFLKSIASDIISNPVTTQQFPFFQCQSKRSAKYLAQAIIQASRIFVDNMLRDTPHLRMTTDQLEARALMLAKVGLSTMLIFDVTATTKRNRPFNPHQYETIKQLEDAFASQRFVLD